MRQMQVFLPAWVRALELEHPLKAALFAALRRNAQSIARLAEAEAAVAKVAELEQAGG